MADEAADEAGEQRAADRADDVDPHILQRLPGEQRWRQGARRVHGGAAGGTGEPDRQRHHGADRQAGRAGYCDSSAHSHFSGASAYGCSDPARARTYVYTHSYSSAHGDASVRHDASGAVRP